MTDEELVDLLGEVSRGLREEIRAVCESHDLPFTTLVMLRHMQTQPGVTVSELARRTGIVKSHISKTVDDLAQQAWVEKRADPGDQRLLRLHLAPAAEQRLLSIRHDLRRRLQDVVRTVPPAQREALVDGLQALHAALDEMRGKGRRA